MAETSSRVSRLSLTHRNKRFLEELSKEFDLSSMVLPAKRLLLDPKDNSNSHQRGNSTQLGNSNKPSSMGCISPNEFLKVGHKTLADPVVEVKDGPNQSLHVLNLSCKAETRHDIQPTVDCGSTSSFASEEYDKENSEDVSGPIDLSQGQRSFVFENGQGANFRSRVEPKVVETFADRISSSYDDRDIHRLQEDLRNEETKLVLLKKIQINQIMHRAAKDLSTSCSSASLASQLIGPSPLVYSGSQQVNGGQRSGNQGVSVAGGRLLPPPLVTSSSSRSSVGVVIPTLKSVHGFVPPARTQNVGSQGHHTQAMVQPQCGQPMPSMQLLPQTQLPSVQPLTQPQLPSVQPLPPPQLPPAQLLPPLQLPSSQPLPPSQPIATPSQADQTPAQKQAAAKVALRKQLEKTLLQIPPPKPPPPEMNFIPNVGSSDFVALLGLEEAVKCILDSDARERGEQISEVKYVFNPFLCIQCHTDFTPVWKRDKPGSKSVICERCVTSNQKRALKQEHTNRLKSAFVKALQQEQEIDRTLLAPSSISASLMTVPSSLVSKNSPGPKLASSSSQDSHHAAMWTPPVLASMGNLSQAFSPQLIFPFPRLPGASKLPLDLQRQYMLDMMPRRTHLDGSALWQA